MTDFDDINVVIEDHLAALEVISQRILNVRKRMQQEDRSEHAIREEQILTAINALTDVQDSTAKKIEIIEGHLLVMVTKLKGMAENLKQPDTQTDTAMQLKGILDGALATMITKMNEWQSLAQMPQSQETVARRETNAEKEVSLEEGPTAEIESERELKEENVGGDDNDLVEEDLQLQDDAPNAEEQDENELREEELHLQEELPTDDNAMDQEEGELAEQDPKKDVEPKAREPRPRDRIEDERRHQQLTEELEQVMEAERNFKQLIQDLADRKVCPLYLGRMTEQADAFDCPGFSTAFRLPMRSRDPPPVAIV
ncbi:unnamed protein product [Cylicocyclus nassatus]|uniref:Uncharacterized protein n=1 Tax=Cylicocyclus nassatus TaxID=53992 RepID=A0AA36MH08_CYLNA|nr:unnamed protein product [Cylicocyclus nassatus]